MSPDSGWPGWEGWASQGSCGPSHTWLQAFPVTKSGEVERTPRAGFYQPSKQKRSPEASLRAGNRGRALFRDTPVAP